jgi:hypothetical protein
VIEPHLNPPTDALPGSPRKVEILARRAAQGLPLFHPLDARLPEGIMPEEQGPVAPDDTCNTLEGGYRLWLEAADQGEKMPRKIPRWKIEVPGLSPFVVEAWTKGEARAAARSRLGLSKRAGKRHHAHGNKGKGLPAGTVVCRADDADVTPELLGGGDDAATAAAG